jgi:hypothetical protein
MSIISFPTQRPLPAAACQRNDAGRPSRFVPSRAGTYLSRPALAAAICVSWTIAVVVGVALIFGA